MGTKGSPGGTGHTTDDTGSYGWCAWHKAFSNTVRLIGVIEQGSGPGTAGNHFACSSCRHIYGLTPLADRP